MVSVRFLSQSVFRIPPHFLHQSEYRRVSRPPSEEGQCLSTVHSGPFQWLSEDFQWSGDRPFNLKIQR
ncbi:hypothetical protein MHYP_G00247090 [Metynnis hypsauchen]